MVNALRSFVFAISCFYLSSGAATGAPYAEYILAPDSRTVYPASVFNINGTVTNADSLTKATGKAAFQGISAVTFDFLKDIGGFVSVTVGNCSSSTATLALAYTESSEWISGNSSDGTQNGVDQLIYLPIGNGPGTYTVDSDHERGGFRYLSLISNTSETITVTSVSVNFTAAPAQNDLQAYTGYFHCNDEVLNRVWYAGAYTCQLCSIDPNRGNAVIGFPAGTHIPGIEIEVDDWYFNYTIANGTSVLTDGAKRDRLVWPGDMAISIPTVFVSTNDMQTIRNSLDSLYILQTAEGMLPYAGVPLPSTASWTYHLHNLIGASDYYYYTGNVSYLNSIWDQWKRGVQWSLSSIDSTGLMEVGSSADWLRSGMGGHNIEANAILYYVLNRGLSLATVLNDSSVVTNWTNAATGVKSAANELLWDSQAGLFKDNETTTLHPQDGNVWAIKSNLTTSSNQSSTISSALRARWGQFGAPAPEAGAIISPFIGGFEVEAHFLAPSAAQNAIDLIRLQWGYMLNDPLTTNSTLIEGYSTDGTLHYVYSNDQRVSHAHGWSTGPTGMLSFYVAGIQITSGAGQTWLIAPQTGDLQDIEGGFETPLGLFSSKVNGSDGIVSALEFSTPDGTIGAVKLENVNGTLSCSGGGCQGSAPVALDASGQASGLKGGSWSLTVQ